MIPEYEEEMLGHADRPYQWPSQAIWDSIAVIDDDHRDTENSLIELTAGSWMEGVHGEVAQRVPPLG